jgi:hypothetical protein
MRYANNLRHFSSGPIARGIYAHNDITKIEWILNVL